MAHQHHHPHRSSGGVSGPGLHQASSQHRGSDDGELELLERQLLESQRQQRAVWVAPGRFSHRDCNHFATFPRRIRNRRSLMTLWADRCLLDESPNKQLRVVLSGSGRWDFNAFALDRLCGGTNLATLCTHLFHVHGLISHFRLSVLHVWKFFALVEQGYHSVNPYHNGVHAADVTQAMHCFLKQDAMRRVISPLEVMAALIAAAVHDLDHPGKNERFLIATNSHLAGLYQNSSVLENHHWRSGLSLLWTSGLGNDLSPGDLARLKRTLREMVLATDITRQREFLDRMQALREEGGLTQAAMAASVGRRLFVLQIAMKCADISNPCRPWNVCRLWSHRASEEFFRQGDREKELELEVSNLCDRNEMTVAKVQVGFYRFIATPLFEEWNLFLSSPLSISMMHNLRSNQSRWDLISQQEARLMVESVTSTSSSSGTTSSFPPGPDSRRESLDPNTGSVSHHQHHLLSPSACEGTHLASRSSADGDEDSDPCLSYPYLPLDEDVAVGTSLSSASTAHFIRRHSLPLSSVPRASSEESDDVILPSTSAVGSSTSGVRRQHSIGDRRRNVPRQASDSSVPSATSHRRRLSHRRNVYASSRSPIQTVESESPDSSFENDREPSPRVTFHFGPDDEEPTVPDRDVGSQRQASGEGEDKENSSTEKAASMRRRGSAPGSLLLSQLGSRSLSVSSRENSPPAVLKAKNLNTSSSSSNLTHRRGSLPVEILPEYLQALAYETQAQPCRPPSSSSSSSSSSKPGAKRKRDRRRRSGGFETSHLQQENIQTLVQQPQQQMAPSKSGHRPHRRGSAPMVRLSPSSGSSIKRNVDAFFFGARSPLIPPPSPFMDRPYKQQHEVEEEEEDDDEEEEVGCNSPPLALMSKRRGSLPTEIINASSTK